MEICIVILVVVIIILFIGIVSYRRQIGKICRQLAFVNENDTNMKLPEDGPISDINLLNEEINKLIEQKKNIHREAKQKEEMFKDTITNISHDIRTPLTSLDGYFQLLQQSDSDKEQEKYISIIEERISSLSDMLEELFTYTKLQNNKYEFDIERMDFGKLIYDTVFSFYDEFKNKKIEPEIEFSEEQFFINGNKEAIRRILQNLIKNAMEHGDSNIVLKLYSMENRVIFECANDVKNAGEIDINQVFTRFYKADSARTHSSTGLGLSIAKGLIEKVGGSIEAELSEGMFIVRVQFKIL